jgi:predicted phosphodiesterase
MRVAYCSDLHLEFDANSTPYLFVDAEVLILAGDVCEAKNIPVEFFQSLCNFYDHVIYVAGNHEFYRSEYNKAIKLLSNIGIDNLHFLQNETVEIEGVVFAGCTLWSHIEPSERWFVGIGMNDYHLIRINDYDKHYRKLSPADTCAEHQRSVDWIRSLSHVDVMITHHLPSFNSVATRYKTSQYNCCYATDLVDLLEDKQFWVHGHTHDAYNYTENGCNVLCNPHGYPNERADGFNLEVFEVFPGKTLTPT